MMRFATGARSFDLSWRYWLTGSGSTGLYRNFLAKPLDLQADEYLRQSGETGLSEKRARTKGTMAKTVKAQTLNVYLDLALAGITEGEAEENWLRWWMTLQPELEEEAQK